MDLTPLVYWKCPLTGRDTLFKTSFCSFSLHLFLPVLSDCMSMIYAVLRRCSLRLLCLICFVSWNSMFLVMFQLTLTAPQLSVSSSFCLLLSSQWLEVASWSKWSRPTVFPTCLKSLNTVHAEEQNNILLMVISHLIIQLSCRRFGVYRQGMYRPPGD